MPQQVARGPPPILLRRLMWLLGCWAEQIPTSLRPPLVQATANVMKVRMDVGAVIVIDTIKVGSTCRRWSRWNLDVRVTNVTGICPRIVAHEPFCCLCLTLKYVFCNVETRGCLAHEQAAHAVFCFVKKVSSFLMKEFAMSLMDY